MLKFTIEKSKTFGKRDDGRYYAVVRFQSDDTISNGDTDNSIAKPALSYNLMSIYPEAKNAEDAYNLFCSEFNSEGVNVYTITVKELCNHDGYRIFKDAGNIISTLQIASYDNKEKALATRKALIEDRIEKGIYVWADNAEIIGQEQIKWGIQEKAFTILYFIPYYKAGLLQAGSDKNFRVYRALFDSNGHCVNGNYSVTIPCQKYGTNYRNHKIVNDWELINVSIKEMTDGKYCLLERFFNLYNSLRGNELPFGDVDKDKTLLLINLCSIFHDAYHLGEIGEYDSSIAFNSEMTRVKELNFAYPCGNDSKATLLKNYKSAIAYGLSNAYIKGITKSTLDEEERLREKESR